eukprot:CAMPEP_0172446300 /NCGR_PEP_ID=MMETSP1065-20121228/5927_1 /TAXON_ID=265537 /ORGANISM="Amphiprora paludosa, Strain CCMP125" /LENGTH=1027 /DNA_ID=CAMNT_0013197383 /DNA_START=45 /DNA_END=3128 /DNA_ORIENTATION=-
MAPSTRQQRGSSANPTVARQKAPPKRAAAAPAAKQSMTATRRSNRVLPTKRALSSIGKPTARPRTTKRSISALEGTLNTPTQKKSKSSRGAALPPQQKEILPQQKEIPDGNYDSEMEWGNDHDNVVDATPKGLLKPMANAPKAVTFGMEATTTANLNVPGFGETAVAMASSTFATRLADGKKTTACSGESMDLNLVAASVVHGQAMVAGPSNDSVMLAAFAKAVPTDRDDTLPSLDDVSAWAEYIALDKNVHGGMTYDLAFVSGNNPKYVASCVRYFERFCEILRRHKKFKDLFVYIQDPQKPSFKILRLFHLLRGEVTEDKKILMNSLLLVFGMNFRKMEQAEKKERRDARQAKKNGTERSTSSPLQEGKLLNDDETAADCPEVDKDDAYKMYQSTTLATVFDCLWSVLHKAGIQVRAATLKNFPRSYHAYMKTIMEAAAKVRPDYGQLPNQAAVFQEDEVFIRTKAKPRFILFDKHYWEDHLRILFYRFDRDIAYRSKEMLTLVRSKLIYHERLDHNWKELEGLSAFEVDKSVFEKTAECSLAKPSLKHDELKARPFVIQNPADEQCTFNMMKWWLDNMLPPEWNGEIFLRQAPAKALKAWGPERAKYPCNTDLESVQVKDSNGRTHSVMKPKGRLGEGYPNKNNKYIGQRCGAPNWEKMMARTCRRTANTNMNKNGTHQVVMNESARHHSTAQNTVYTDPDQTERNRAYTTNWVTDKTIADATKKQLTVLEKFENGQGLVLPEDQPKLDQSIVAALPVLPKESSTLIAKDTILEIAEKKSTMAQSTATHAAAAAPEIDDLNDYGWDDSLDCLLDGLEPTPVATSTAIVAAQKNTAYFQKPSPKPTASPSKALASIHKNRKVAPPGFGTPPPGYHLAYVPTATAPTTAVAPILDYTMVSAQQQQYTHAPTPPGFQRVLPPRQSTPPGFRRLPARIPTPPGFQRLPAPVRNPTPPGFQRLAMAPPAPRHTPPGFQRSAPPQHHFATTQQVHYQAAHHYAPAPAPAHPHYPSTYPPPNGSYPPGSHY